MPLLTFVDIYNPYVETRSLESTNKASCSQIFMANGRREAET